MEITPEIQELIDEKVKEARTSFEEEKDKIAGNAKKLLNEKKNLEERLSQFDDIDIDEIKSIKQALKDREEEDLLKSGKIDELVNKRSQAIRIELENTIKDREERIQALEQDKIKLNSSYDEYRIRDALTREARAAKVLDSAVEDLILRARGTFSITSDGNIIALDSEGNIRTNKDGKAITPESFIKDLKKTAPHLWPSSAGANLVGSGDDNTPFGRGSTLDEAAKSGDMKKYREARRAQQKRG